MLSYDNWFEKIGYKKKEELEKWLDNKPDWFELDEVIDIDDIIIDLYDNKLSEYENRVYEEWKDNR